MRRIPLLLATLGILFIVFFALHSLVDYTADDFALVKGMSSPGDIPARAWWAHENWDGRAGAFLINHTLLFLPKALTAGLLALLIPGIAALLCIHALGKDWRERLTWKHLLCAFCLFWLSIPAFGQAFLWRTGSCYGVLGALSLLFLLPYRRLVDSKESPSWSLFFCIPLGLEIGLGDYNTSIVLACLALCAGIFACARDRRVRVLPFLPPLALLAGFYTAFTAPGNATRLLAQGVTGSIAAWEGIGEHIRNQPDVQGYYLWPYLLMAVSLLIWLAARSRRKKRDHPQNAPSTGRPSCLTRFGRYLLEERPLLYTLIFFLAAQAAQAAFIFAPYASKRAYTSSALFMIAAALTLFFFVWPRRRDAIGRLGRRLVKLYWAVIFAVSLTILGNVFIMFQANRAYFEACEAAALAAAPGDLCLPPHPYRANPYLFSGRDMQPYDDRSYFINRDYAVYYGLASVGLCAQNFTLVPEENGGVDFQGEVRDSLLRFRYQPSAANREKPFVFAFIQAPRNPLRHALERLLQSRLEDSRLFRKSVANRYDKARPEIVSSQEGVLSGSAAMPHVEHTDRAYILHYDGKAAADVIPLRIVRKR